MPYWPGLAWRVTAEPNPFGACRQADHIPSTAPYPLGECLADLLDLAARLLVVGGRLVYFIPSALETYSPQCIPVHPGLKLIANCEQMLTRRWGRRLITMEKCSDYDASLAPAAKEDIIQRASHLHVYIRESGAAACLDEAVSSCQASRCDSDTGRGGDSDCTACTLCIAPCAASSCTAPRQSSPAHAPASHHPIQSRPCTRIAPVHQHALRQTAVCTCRSAGVPPPYQRFRFFPGSHTPYNRKRRQRWEEVMVGDEAPGVRDDGHTPRQHMCVETELAALVHLRRVHRALVAEVVPVSHVVV
eukprot:scaffold927_cov375-Prasinococcus_capsulatus_cf.AAC.7